MWRGTINVQACKHVQLPQTDYSQDPNQFSVGTFKTVPSNAYTRYLGPYCYVLVIKLHIYELGMLLSTAGGSKGCVARYVLHNPPGRQTRQDCA